MKTITTSLVESVKRWAVDCSTPAADEPMSILVVDDEASIRRYVDRVLSGAGYRTTLAADGADAIAAAARGGRFGLLQAVSLAITGSTRMATRAS
jgi:CheY-like chemotaxis protein